MAAARNGQPLDTTMGFAVGRTTFWDPLMAWKDQQVSHEGVLTEIAQRYRKWVDMCEGAYAA